jgi:hypothetical protein
VNAGAADVARDDERWTCHGVRTSVADGAPDRPLDPLESLLV